MSDRKVSEAIEAALESAEGELTIEGVQLRASEAAGEVIPLKVIAAAVKELAVVGAISTTQVGPRTSCRWVGWPAGVVPHSIKVTMPQKPPSDRELVVDLLRKTPTLPVAQIAAALEIDEPTVRRIMSQLGIQPVEPAKPVERAVRPTERTRPVGATALRVKEAFEKNRTLTIKELAAQLLMDAALVRYHLKNIGVELPTRHKAISQTKPAETVTVGINLPSWGSATVQATPEEGQRLQALIETLQRAAERPEPPVPAVRHCDACNAPRHGDSCHKCGGATAELAVDWEYPAVPDIARVRALAREVGYAIGEHGTKERDVDLIAAPWAIDAVANSELLEHIAKGMNARVVSTELKPLGRLAATIQCDGWFKLLDISVCPPAYQQSPVFSSIDIVKADPVPMILWCPSCAERHIDEGEWETKPHHTHACQACGFVWRQATADTVGVRFLPGFKNADDRAEARTQ